MNKTASFFAHVRYSSDKHLSTDVYYALKPYVFQT